MFSRPSLLATRHSALIAIFAATVYLLLIYSRRIYDGNRYFRLPAGPDTHPGGFSSQIPRLQEQATQPSRGIPKKLWYKFRAKGPDAKTSASRGTCIRNNTDHDVVFMTDASADAYVQNKPGKLRPDYADIYLNLSEMWLALLRAAGAATH